ncbi:hypothetical protein ACRAWD_16910 [Caulobacter segnis]
MGKRRHGRPDRSGQGPGSPRCSRGSSSRTSASLGPLRSQGFREVGVHQRHGQLDGVWRDVVAVERLIGT